MHSTTLKGIFPEPKPIHRRNFIKENMKSIKHMQGILQDVGVIQPRKQKFPEKYKNVPRMIKSRDSSSTSSQALVKPTKTEQKATQSTNPQNSVKLVKSKFVRKKCDGDEGRISHRAMQTEREEDLPHLYETGVIKYASPGIPKFEVKNKKPECTLKPPQSGQGDQNDHMEVLEDKDFIKDNKQNIKPRPIKQNSTKVPSQAPASYKRGELPKYLKDKKQETEEEPEPECPPGHILLPEEERKETLRVLRQSYAARIQELNMMPVRNDTLKMRRRKMDIEEELKRIDGGIKVFQRPKVFVKINA
ncbi:enkurin domain-containing protein 1 isoform X2 [Cylas formicarius]|uniref:enkurin domain-containing protein 1 isoform X2 n=1 Tax=Cylas formicarius TaxID=197179 RepID=UPI0029586EF6|nr:enkurin domain-containing protein 1 isoform X2 [Cylas formicarius]